MRLEIPQAQLLALASAVAAAHRLGLTHALAAGPTPVDALADRLGLAERPLRLLLDVMVSFDLAERAGDRYAAGPVLRAAQRRVPGSLAEDAALWAHLPAWLASDRPLTGIDRGRAGRELLYADVVAGLGEMASAAARTLADRLGPAGRVLDVGCGSGVWSLALAERDCAAQVTGVDFPAVLAVFAEQARARGLADRVATLAGDAHELAVPAARHDTLLLANLLRLEPAARARALVLRWAPALVAGGRLVVVDALASGTGAADRARSLYALHLGLRSAAGSVHPPEEVAGWLAEAGLVDVTPIALGEAAEHGALAALVATRPA